MDANVCRSFIETTSKNLPRYVSEDLDSQHDGLSVTAVRDCGRARAENIHRHLRKRRIDCK